MAKASIAGRASYGQLPPLAALWLALRSHIQFRDDFLEARNWVIAEISAGPDATDDTGRATARQWYLAGNWLCARYAPLVAHAATLDLPERSFAHRIHSWFKYGQGDWQRVYDSFTAEREVHVAPCAVYVGDGEYYGEDLPSARGGVSIISNVEWEDTAWGKEGRGLIVMYDPDTPIDTIVNTVRASLAREHAIQPQARTPRAHKQRQYARQVAIFNEGYLHEEGRGQDATKAAMYKRVAASEGVTPEAIKTRLNEARDIFQPQDVGSITDWAKRGGTT